MTLSGYSTARSRNLANQARGPGIERTSYKATLSIVIPVPPEPRQPAPGPYCTALQLVLRLCFRRHERLVRFARFHGLVHDRRDSPDHRFGMVTLEDVAAHVDSGTSFFDCPAGHGQGAHLVDLLAARPHP